MTKIALITGASGQDGSYLIKLLLAQGYEVHAQSRSMQPVRPSALTWHVGELTDQAFLEQLLANVAPDEIYNLAAVSRPALSWDIPYETTLLNAVVPQKICDYIARTRARCRLFQASSSEMFGNSSDPVQTELTVQRPESPYGISKAFAHQMVGIYRTRFGLHASCGILFNHESPRRQLGFVTMKIAHAAAAISLGLAETRELDERGLPIVSNGKLQLGNIAIRRDFGFAGDVVRAMYLMVQSDQPDDFIVGTGQNHSIAEFCETAFNVVGIDWRDHVKSDSSLVRPTDTFVTQADASKLTAALGWKPEYTFEEIVAMMVNERITALKAA